MSDDIKYSNKKNNVANNDSNSLELNFYENELPKIKELSRKWERSLFTLTFAYIIFYFSWTLIVSYVKSVSKDYCISIQNNLFDIVAAIIGVIFVGVLYSIDGVVTAWLKTPFGQISYAINKSSMDEYTANEITNDLTEINEQFKETFKKFGITAITIQVLVLIKEALKNLREKEELSVSDLELSFLNSFSFKLPNDATFVYNTLSPGSLLVPIYFAYLKIKKVRILIDEAKISERLIQ